MDFVKDNIKAKNKFNFKSDFGKVTIFAGSKGFSGAAFIASEAAIKSGSGLVTLVCDEDIQDIISSKLSEGMTANYKEENRINKLIEDSSAIGFGCGMGDNKLTLERLEYVLNKSNCPMIIDADGLNVLKDNINILKKYKNRIIITPHLGEMSRLTGKSISYIKENRLDVAKELQKKII